MKTKNLKEGWEVQWCIYVKVDEDGMDPDSAVYEYADFTSKDQAIKHAEKMLPVDQFGSVRVTEFHSEPYEIGFPGTFREYDGEPEYIEK